MNTDIDRSPTINQITRGPSTSKVTASTTPGSEHVADSKARKGTENMHTLVAIMNKSLRDAYIYIGSVGG